jgi:hypothetical protein
LCQWNRRHCELQLEPNRGLIDLLNARRCCRQTSANRFARRATDERSDQSENLFCSVTTIEQSSGIRILSPSAVDTSCNRSVMFVQIDRSFGKRRERLRGRIRQLTRLPKRV